MAVLSACSILMLWVLTLHDPVLSFRDRRGRGISPKFGALREVQQATRGLSRSVDDQIPIFSSPIINGKPAKRKGNPWQAGLFRAKRLNKAPFCGGSLITNRHVLTAAHCLYKKKDYLIFFTQHVRFKKDELIVSLGMYDWSRNESLRQDYGVRRIIIHEGYRSVAKDDIALLELDSEVELGKYINTIRLPPRNAVYNGKTARVAGWGLLRAEEDGGKQPEKLHSVDLKVFEYDGQNDDNENACWRNIKERNNRICADLDNDGKDHSCGDSGGAMTVKNPETHRREIIGVVYGHVVSTRLFWTGVYMKVTHYLDWIGEETGFKIP